MYVIGIDVATKSLATSIIKYKSNKIVQKEMDLAIENYKVYKKLLIENNLTIKSMNELLKKYQELLECINLSLCPIEILFIDVKDLIPDKKLKETDIIERTNSLRNYLNSIDKEIQNLILNSGYNNEWTILIEYQMGPNDKSRTISSQLLYHFSKYSESKIELVGPSLKNSLFLKNVESSKYSNFLEKYSTNYSANKAHSKYLFLELLKNMNKTEIINDIKKKNIDDIADSVLMSLAWLKKNEII